MYSPTAAMARSGFVKPLVQLGIQSASKAPPNLSLCVRPPEGDEKTWGRPGVKSFVPPNLSLCVRPPEGDEKTWGRPGVFSTMIF
jgi:hypothetical protein